MQRDVVRLDFRVEIHTTSASTGTGIGIGIKENPLAAMEPRGGTAAAAGVGHPDEEQQLGYQQRQPPHLQTQASCSSASSAPGCRPSPAATRSWCTARTILGTFSIMLSLALLGLGIKMSVVYDEVPLIHVSFAFVGFTAATSMAWESFEFITMCARRGRRGIYPGAHVGVHICLCLACVATMGYVCFWVSQGERWKYVEVHGHAMAYSPLYHIGIVVVILTFMLLLTHFILSILACKEVRKKDEGEPYRTVVTVRYDGVGPDGTARPLSYAVPPETINLPVYTARSSHSQGSRAASVVMTNQALSETPANGTTSPRVIEKPGN